MIKIQIPATSANLGAGFDSLGLAVNLYNFIELEPWDRLEISSADNTEVPTDETNLVYTSVKYLFDLCGKPLNRIWNGMRRTKSNIKSGANYLLL